jgi:ABC-type dipeptide/oligopeptide/nickel transport system permease component
MVRLNPTDPVAVIFGGKQTTAETIANMRADFNQDKSFVERYRIWISGIFRGDFGTSFMQKCRNLIVSYIYVENTFEVVCSPPSKDT